MYQCLRSWLRSGDSTFKFLGGDSASARVVCCPSASALKWPISGLWEQSLQRKGLWRNQGVSEIYVAEESHGEPKSGGHCKRERLGKGSSLNVA